MIEREKIEIYELKASKSRWVGLVSCDRVRFQWLSRGVDGSRSRPKSRSV